MPTHTLMFDSPGRTSSNGGDRLRSLGARVRKGAARSLAAVGVAGFIEEAEEGEPAA